MSIRLHRGFILLSAVLVGILVGRALLWQFPPLAGAAPQAGVGADARPGGSATTTGTVSLRQNPGAAVQQPAPQAPPLGPTRTLASHPLDVGINPLTGLVTVSGAADVYDTTPDARYVRSIRVYRYPKGPLFREHHYVDQAVWLPEGQTTIKPEFHDEFPLPPGDYKVELSLYAVDVQQVRQFGFDWRRVKPGEDLGKRLSRVSRGQRIRVGG